MVGEEDVGAREGDEIFGLEMGEKGGVDREFGAGCAGEEAEADGKSFMEAGEGGELFVEVAGQGVLGEEVLPFFEVADVAEAAPFPVTEGGGAKS